MKKNAFSVICMLFFYGNNIAASFWVPDFLSGCIPSAENVDLPSPSTPKVKNSKEVPVNFSKEIGRLAVAISLIDEKSHFAPESIPEEIVVTRARSRFDKKGPTATEDDSANNDHKTLLTSPEFIEYLSQTTRIEINLISDFTHERARAKNPNKKIGNLLYPYFKEFQSVKYESNNRSPHSVHHLPSSPVIKKK